MCRKSYVNIYVLKWYALRKLEEKYEIISFVFAVAMPLRTQYRTKTKQDKTTGNQNKHTNICRSAQGIMRRWVLPIPVANPERGRSPLRLSSILSRVVWRTSSQQSRSENFGIGP